MKDDDKKRKKTTEEILEEVLGKESEQDTSEDKKTTVEDVKEEVEEMEEVKKNADEKLAELEDKYLRLAAEFENYKKRQHKEYQRIVELRTADFFRDFIPIFENIKRAYEVETKTDEGERICEGLCLIYKELLKLLEKRDIHKIPVEVGDEFDSETMEAICLISTDEYGPNKVIEVNEVGYMYGDTLLRPTKVSVSCKPQPEEDEDD